MEEEKKEMLVNENENNYMIMGIDELSHQTNTKTQVITNITDEKKLFNLETNVDELLNDCEGELIRVKEVLIKKYEKPLKEPIIDEETGEIIKDKEMTMSTVIVDENNTSYATGSKTFGIQLLRYLQLRTLRNAGNEPFEIKIIKRKSNKSQNKCLAFELV